MHCRIFSTPFCCSIKRVRESQNFLFTFLCTSHSNDDEVAVDMSGTSMACVGQKVKSKQDKVSKCQGDVKARRPC
ncbi:hypothetical protein MPTK1_5g13940 [Marchantia polymorpha subsp. ruderalis]|uniref:Uncharacterized protein n=2 Tax=Marchantia polymorpha TaxID=3197 RepID=A0AAF6BI49_MARPO|nr:hypothetical protein MARPO_0032s0084 [Marchantia polymorpha]BBN11683.1 hypothetical protein Mp_5g13940 [Marchantia polymorpha subsp. ruderalis]|eukprot:PTQ41897.1 hypothetical protein MARPO_0032s0084 [Marchantia polymorpha]